METTRNEVEESDQDEILKLRKLIMPWVRHVGECEHRNKLTFECLICVQNYLWSLMLDGDHSKFWKLRLGLKAARSESLSSQKIKRILVYFILFSLANITLHQMV